MHREPAERLGEYIVYLLQDVVHLAWRLQRRQACITAQPPFWWLLQHLSADLHRLY